MKYPRSTKRLAALVVTAILSLGVSGSMAPPAVATTPGTPGVVQPGTPVYTEDFSHQDASTAAISIVNYLGGAAAASEAYAADTPYTPAGGQCNGWILNSGTPLPASDAGCARNQPEGWGQIQQMAVELGLAQGQSAAQAARNQTLSEYTNHATGQIAAGAEFRTTANSIPAIAGHYYAVSAYFAAVNCHAARASETFSLLVNGVPRVLGSGLDPCGDSTSATVQVTKLQSDAYMIPAGSSPSLGLELRNESTTGFGNDVAFDLPQIVDVTPQLDMSFTQSLIGPGARSTLVLTVTNTDDLKAKSDWSITDALPAGVVVAGNPAVGGTCAEGPGTNAFVTTAMPGSNTLSVTGGDLLPGQASCTVTVDVTSDAEGTYVTGPASIVTNLNPPADAALTMRAPRIALSLALGAPRLADTDQFTAEIRAGSVTAPVVNSTSNSTTTGSGSTVSAGAGATGLYAADAGTTYYLTESGNNLPGYTKAITCTDANRLQPGLPQGAAFTDSLALVPVAGANISCVLTNTAVLAPAMEFAQSADAPDSQSPPAAGDLITYTFTAKNTGNVALTGVRISDPLPGIPPVNYNWPGTPGTLLPGQTLTAVATYAITQADIDAGHVANSATISGNPPTGPPVTPPPGTSDTPLMQGPGMEFSTAADASVTQNPAVVGDVIAYTFTSKNTGNVTLTNVSITDPFGDLPDVVYSWPGSPGELLPGQAVTARTTYEITQADIDAGSVANSATTTGTPPTGPPLTPAPDTTDTLLTPEVGLEFTKAAHASLTGHPTGVSGLVTYSFTVKNTGTIPLAKVAVNDHMPGLSALVYTWPGAEGALLPGETAIAVATYAITQTDINAGKVVNTATATGTSPTGRAVGTSPASAVLTIPPGFSGTTDSPSGNPEDPADPSGNPADPSGNGAGGNGTVGNGAAGNNAGTAGSHEDSSGKSEESLAHTGVVLMVLPIGLVMAVAGLLLFLAGRRRRSRA